MISWIRFVFATFKDTDVDSVYDFLCDSFKPVKDYKYFTKVDIQLIQNLIITLDDNFTKQKDGLVNFIHEYLIIT